MTTLAWIHWQEILIIAVVAVLIFGRRLPEVGRNIGRALVEFKKGLRGVKDEVEDVVDETRDVASENDQPDRDEQQKQ